MLANMAFVGDRTMKLFTDMTIQEFNKLLPLFKVVLHEFEESKEVKNSE